MRAASPSRRRVIRAALFAYAAALCLYSLVPGTFPGAAIVNVLPGRDLAAHGVAYAGLAFFLCVAVTTSGPYVAPWPVGVLLISAGCAAILELAQAVVPWRTASGADMIASLVGVVLMCALCAAGRSVLVARPGRHSAD